MKKKTNVIYVYSGKGGVGKSTIALNLAFSFKGLRVGLFDADLEGPSIPNLLNGLNVTQPMTFENMNINPAVVEGIKVSSSGFIGNKSENVYLSGRILEGALDQLIFNADWDVDILIIDLPPGTGQIHKNLISKLNGEVVLVTTPQEVSFQDTQRGLDFLRKLDVKVIGVIENMASYQCSCCDSIERIFSADTEKQFTLPNKLNLLGSIPLIGEISSSHENTPFVLKYPDHNISKIFKALAERILLNDYTRA